MKKADKFLIGIVIAIILIVVAAFVVTMTRPEETYLAEDSPENIVHNYLLAIQREEYERAYRYLWPQIIHYPASQLIFEQDIEYYSWTFGEGQDITLSVKGATIRENLATVEVLESRFYGGNLFDSGQSVSTFKLELILRDGEWKIKDGDAYFVWCWTAKEGCEK